MNPRKPPEHKASPKGISASAKCWRLFELLRDHFKLSRRHLFTKLVEDEAQRQGIEDK